MLPHPVAATAMIAPTTTALHPATSTIPANATSNRIATLMKDSVHTGRELSMAPMSVVQRDTIRASGTVSSHLKFVINLQPINWRLLTGEGHEICFQEVFHGSYVLLS